MLNVDPNLFPTLLNERILKAIKNEKVDKIPVWIMRQAGRFLPEFREFRLKHDFFEICQTPELACEVTLMPIKRFQLDAAIIFSDILLIPQCLGIVVEMKQGILIKNPLTNPSDFNKLTWPKFPPLSTHQNGKEAEPKNHDILMKVYEAITLTRMKLNGEVPLIGFAGAPWTLMCYMVDGGSSTTFMKSRSWLYKYSEDSLFLLQKLTEVIAQHLINQARAGAQLLQVFESHGECLNRQLFQRFSAPFLKTIAEMVKAAFDVDEKPPLILFVKGGHHSLSLLNTLGYDVISLDWTIDPAEARKILGPQQCVQGNLDPSALFGSKEALQNLTSDMISRFGTKGYIANLGHGIYPETPLENVTQFIETIHSYPTNL